MKYLFTYCNRLLILLAMYTASRIYFYLNNSETIDLHYFLEFLEGLRFDISALVYINIPLFIMLLLPHNLRTHNYYHKLTNWLFYGVNIPFLLLNNIDIEYFKFTQKRSTTDFFQLMSLGSDAKNIIPQYLKDYWLITLFSILQVYLLLKIKQLPQQKFELKIKPISKQLFVLAFASGLLIVSARGGLQLKPIKPINAGELSGSQNTSLILNTPFCILHSLNEKPLEEYNYFKKEDLTSIYSPIHLPQSQQINKQNIVILILESFSKEFIGYYNEGKGHTPFLDSLMQQGIVFNNAYANGLKSIEALPAITASIPTLMNNPFITSNYAQNKIESLASILNKEGYNTSFFHGGERGTMGFYSFSRKVGFQEYHGMKEYNNNANYDGSWGIFDAPFMQYFSKELNKKKEPFFTTFFSLSSHPPYVLPKDYKHNKIVTSEGRDEGMKGSTKMMIIALLLLMLVFFLPSIKNRLKESLDQKTKTIPKTLMAQTKVFFAYNINKLFISLFVVIVVLKFVFDVLMGIGETTSYQPENHTNKNSGEISATIQYSDYALQQFFKSIENEDWYQNTLFIVTADHTSGASYDKKYKTKIGRYAIPLLLFKGDGSLKGVRNNIVQQIDIMPTLLEKIDYNKPYFAFGKSMLSKESWAISKLNDNYRFITDEGFINNKLEKYPTFSNWGLNNKTSSNQKNIELLKAIKQDYNVRMTNNSLTYEN